jgi:hypothetical protein
LALIPRIRIQGTLRNESYGFEKVEGELVKKVREHVYEAVLARDVVRISIAYQIGWTF